MKMSFMKKATNAYLLNEMDECVDAWINEWKVEYWV